MLQKERMRYNIIFRTLQTMHANVQPSLSKWTKRNRKHEPWHAQERQQASYREMCEKEMQEIERVG